MASLASTAVSIYPTGADSYIGRDQQVVRRRLKLVLTGQGGLTNTITAAALGFSKLHECSGLVDTAGGKGYLAVVDPTLNTIILFDGAAAPAPVDVTSTASYICVTGNPALAR